MKTEFFLIPHRNCIQLDSKRVNWRIQPEAKHGKDKAKTHHVTRRLGQIHPYLNVRAAPS